MLKCKYSVYVMLRGKLLADFEKWECILILRSNTKIMFEINNKIIHKC